MLAMRANRWALLSGAVLWLACGGGGGDAETTGGEGDTSGGEGDVATADPVETDPCAPSEGVPCEEGTETPDAGTAREGVAEGGETGEGTGEEEGGEEGTEDTTEEDDPEADPQVRWRRRVARGRAAFNRTCDTCHPGGEEDIGPDIRRIRWNVERMTRQIRRGGGRMRPIPPARLPEDRVEDLMAFLSTMGSVRGVERP
jgi:hypothetical protein